MIRRAMLLLPWLLLAAPASAAWRSTSGAAAWYDADLPSTTLRLAPTVALDAPRGVLVGGMMMSSSTAQAAYRGSRLAGGWLLDPLARLPLELRASAAHRGGPLESDRGLVRAEARLHFGSPGVGGWMAIAREGTFGLNGQASDRPFIGFGTWARKSGMVLSLDLEQRSGLLPQTTRTPTPAPAPPETTRGVGLGDDVTPSTRNTLMRVALTTTRASLQWRADRLELESVAGVTLSLVSPPRRWAQASAAFQAAPNFSLFATFGSRDPELYLIEPADTPRATFGFRLSDWRSASLDVPLVARGTATGWRARRMDDRTWSLEVRAPGARLVELAGDFTSWEPLALQHVSGDRWTATVLLEAGVHQVNVRLDGGAWMPPPGAPTTADGYGGTTGVLVAD
jgi:hypothetical protein